MLGRFGMKFGTSAWVSVWHGYHIITFRIGVFLIYLFIFLYLYITTGIERTNGLIRIKFGMSIWDGCRMAITLLKFELLYFSLSIYFSICVKSMGLIELLG